MIFAPQSFSDSLTTYYILWSEITSFYPEAQFPDRRLVISRFRNHGLQNFLNEGKKWF